MKINASLIALIASVSAGVTFTSCTNGDEFNEPVAQESKVINYAPAKASKITFSSGSTILATTEGVASRSDVTDYLAVNTNYFKVQDHNPANKENETLYAGFANYWQYGDNAPATTDRGEQVSQAEYDAVMDYLKKHPNEGSTKCNLVNYFIQNVGSSKDSYVSGEDYQGNHSTQTVVGGDKMDYFVLNGLHSYDYNAVYGVRALILGVPVTGGDGPQYHDSYSSKIVSNKYRFYYIDGDGDGKLECYLCFDYEGIFQNGDVVADGDYSDWVIKLIPADGSEITEPTPDPDPDPTPEPDPTPDPDPTPVVKHGQVEVNLSINETKEKDDYISSKLSIHVRDTTDIEVFIPIPSQFYCDPDDMYIIQKHDVSYVYSETEKTVSMEIAGQTVKLTVTHKDGGILVKSEGINAEVLKYLRETYGDGLTFEVWNYYIPKDKDVTVSRDIVKQYLDQSTIKCTTEEYINTKIIDLDCTVTKE